MNQPQAPNQLAILQQVAKPEEFSKLLDLINDAQRAGITARQADDKVRLSIMDLEQKYREKLMAIAAPPTPAPNPVPAPPVRFPKK